MGVNLGESLDSFIEKWENDYKLRRGICPHHDSRFDEGWIPFRMEPYSPSLGRFEGKSELARKIVAQLESEGQFIFEKYGNMALNFIEPALKEIIINIPIEIVYLIADYGTDPLMLDRKAFTTDNQLIECYIQWYLHK